MVSAWINNASMRLCTISDATSHAESRGYIGERQDTETGLTYLHARYYDPALGVFLSPDPLGGGYTYGSGNPANLTDPSGLDDNCPPPTNNSTTVCAPQPGDGGKPQVGPPLWIIWQQLCAIMPMACNRWPTGEDPRNGGGGTQPPGGGTTPTPTPSPVPTPQPTPEPPTTPPPTCEGPKCPRYATHSAEELRAQGYSEEFIRQYLEKGQVADLPLEPVDGPAALLVGGMTAKFAKTPINMVGRVVNANRGLEIAEAWLGSEYREIGMAGSGVFRSADGLRQFRMTAGDILGLHGSIGPHFNFEWIDRATGAVIANLHVPITGH